MPEIDDGTVEKLPAAEKEKWALLKKHQEDIIIPAEFYYDFSPDYKHKNCRLTNLLNAFIFIIQRPEINKDNLKKLYSIISKIG